MLGTWIRPRGRCAGLLLAASAATAALLLAVPASADTSDDRHRVDKELQQASVDLEGLTDRAKQAVIDYGRATATLPGVQAALAEARGQVAGAQSAASQAQREADAARAVADEAQRKYDAAVAEVDQARDEIAKFVSAAYRGNTIAMFNAVLDSQSPSDVIASVGYLQRAAQTRRDALDTFVDGRLNARQQSDVAAAASEKATRAAEAAQRALDQALRIQQSAEQAAAVVQATLARQAAAIAAAESERGAVIARYNHLKAQSAAIADQLRRAARTHPRSPGVSNPGSSAALLWPTNGEVSSPFGLRMHPILGYVRMHTGIDISAAGGTPIYAAADGVVVQAGEHGGYGNFTCLYHGTVKGNGLSTCYAHQSLIGVHEGQSVSRGDTIGWVGTTGLSTGNHLHFEVRLDGEAVDPLGWL